MSDDRRRHGRAINTRESFHAIQAQRCPSSPHTAGTVSDSQLARVRCRPLSSRLPNALGSSSRQGSNSVQLRQYNERVILALRRAGVEQFRVVVGTNALEVAATLRSRRRLSGLSLAFVRCPDARLGNGLSLATGAAGLDECSSASAFTDWKAPPRAPPRAASDRAPVQRALTWLLRIGWKRHWLVAVGGRPKVSL